MVYLFQVAEGGGGERSAGCEKTTMSRYRISVHMQTLSLSGKGKFPTPTPTPHPLSLSTGTGLCFDLFQIRSSGSICYGARKLA